MMNHHSSHEMESQQSELLKRFQQQKDGTAPRQYPDGRISGDDDGAVVIKVGSDPDKGVVYLDFGKEVVWTAMSPEQAIGMAQSLIKHARTIAKEPLTVVLY